MSFSPWEPKLFNKSSVENYAPYQNGVYGLFIDHGPWIYIGKGNIKTRLLAHLNGDNACITAAGPTHFVFEITQNMDVREKELLSELPTRCNQRLG